MRASSASPYYKSSSYGQALLLVAKAPRWRSLFLTFLLFIIACWTWRASDSRFTHNNFLSWNNHAGRYTDESDTVRPPVLNLSNLTLDLESGEHTNVPAQLRKQNPQFHLLIHAPKINAGVCRCLLSSYILDYPPPTLVGYQPPDTPSQIHNQTDDESSPASRDQNGIPDVSAYLSSQRRIRDEDAVLVVDGETTLFQLPSEVLLSKFASEHRHRNHHLATQYPPVTLQSSLGPRKVQRFNQSVIFASSRETFTTPGPARYDYRGRPKPAISQTKVENNINDATIIGTGKSVRRLFRAASKANNQIVRSDRTTFKTMHAQQTETRSSVFDPPLHRRNVWRIWKLRLLAKVSVDHAVRAEQEKEARAAALRDLGIGLDDASEMIYTIPDGNSPHTADRRVGLVPSANASGLEMPDVLREQGVRGPFALHPSHLHLNSTPPPQPPIARAENQAEKVPPVDAGWDSIPLLLNPKTPNIPPLISGSSDDVWEKMWLYPYARTLLNQYLVRGRSKEVASEAAVGGERWWDSRGGRGGVWTTEGEWIDADDLCSPFGGDVFKDGEDFWGEEGREPIEEPKVRVIVVPPPPADDAEGENAELSDTAELSASAPAQEEEQPTVETDEEKNMPIAIMPDGTRKALSDWANSA